MDRKVVLTLFGGSPQPKQLFSSLENPAYAPSASQTGSTTNGLNGRINNDPSCAKALPPLREAALPHAISTTQIVPVQPADPAAGKKRVLTLGEILAAPASLQPFSSLRPTPKHAPSKGNMIGWVKPPDLESKKSSKHGGYVTQPLPTGQWLCYDIAPKLKDLTSGDRRIQKDGGSDSKAALSPEVIALYHKNRADALFKSSYSSFAPCRDDSAAIIPESLKNRMWWHRHGQERMQRMLLALAPPATMNIQNNIDPDLDKMDTSPDGVDELQAFQEAVDAFIPDDIPKENIPIKPETVDKEVHQVLDEISELLETLYTHQRLRALNSFHTSQKKVTPEKPPSGSTTLLAPATGELDVFDMLKSQLVILIGMLPPYAVARLNGDQLEELNIKTSIPVESQIYAGVMEEDDNILKLKSASNSASISVGSRQSAHSPAVHGAANQYLAHTPAHQSRQPHLAQVSSGRPAHASISQSNYYQSQSPSRGPRTPAAGAPGYPLKVPTGSHRTATSTHQAAMSHLIPHTPQSQPRPQLNPQHFQRQSSSYSAYNSGPQPSPQARYKSPSQPQYQERSPAKQYATPNANAIQYNNTSSHKSGSYRQAAQLAAAQSTFAQTPQQRQYFQHSTPSAPPPQQQPLSAVGASGFHTFLSPSEQSLMMERQRAQLAAQNTTPARSAAHATPGHIYPGQNGAVVQQNGVLKAMPNGAN
ncbi:MAG: hypothetical protein M1829_002013 [Trizodia sp. TS-e1964]|nr:MAG: hypothetical protein M1829_002013 [Trizodia sp. TS-e1964]